MKITNNKMSKWLLCMAMLLLLSLALTGCAKKPEEPAPEADVQVTESAEAEGAGNMTSYIFEAEHVDLTEKAGAGPSNAAFETELVLKDTDASGGNYIGYTYFTDLSFDFAIVSDAAAEADMKITLGSDLGIITMNPAVFEISVNGTPVEYADMKLPDSSGKMNKVFKTFNVGKVNLAEGDNTITLHILANELYNGTTGGPLIDNIALDTTATLTWTPVETNVQ